MGSARLGYAADGVLLYRKMNHKETAHYYGTTGKPDAEAKQLDMNERGIAPMILTLEKGRDGMIRGSWGVEFHFHQSRFVELASTTRARYANSKRCTRNRSPATACVAAPRGRDHRRRHRRHQHAVCGPAHAPAHHHRPRQGHHRHPGQGPNQGH